jgi:hypothetical protein
MRSGKKFYQATEIHNKSQFLNLEPILRLLNLQLQRCKNLQHLEQPSAFCKQNILSSSLKNALAYYNAGVTVSSKVVGLAPDATIFLTLKTL